MDWRENTWEILSVLDALLFKELKVLRISEFTAGLDVIVLLSECRHQDQVLRRKTFLASRWGRYMKTPQSFKHFASDLVIVLGQPDSEPVTTSLPFSIWVKEVDNIFLWLLVWFQRIYTQWIVKVWASLLRSLTLVLGRIIYWWVSLAFFEEELVYVARLGWTCVIRTVFLAAAQTTAPLFKV